MICKACLMFTEKGVGKEGRREGEGRREEGGGRREGTSYIRRRKNIKKVVDMSH